MRTSKALSRMSSSSSSAGVSKAAPVSTYTWQVEQAHTPPQASPSGAPDSLAAFNSVVPSGTSISTPCSKKRTFVMRLPCSMFRHVRVDARRVRHTLLDSAQIPAGNRGLDGAVHAPPSPLVSRVVQRADGIFNRRRSAGGGSRVAGGAQSALDVLALSFVEQVCITVERLVCGEQDTCRFYLVVAQPPQLEITLAVIQGIDQHLLDFVVGQPVARLHLHALADARRELHGLHAEQVVLVHVEAHFEPGKPRR